jgi:hypothetical protein
MNYGPYVCIGAVLAILFIIWAFWGGKNYEFVGLAPLAPETCGSYTGSVYNWGQITPATEQPVDDNLITYSDSNTGGVSSLIDNTPSIPPQFQYDICVNEETPPVESNVPLILDSGPNRPKTPRTQYAGRIVNGNVVFDPITNPALLNLPKASFNNNTQISQPRNTTRNSRGRVISRGERMCCETMKRIYGVPFESIWPDWLINPETGQPLELDCYNPELQIAVEYNGEQHYKWPNFTNQTHQEFINQVRRDELKMQLCDRNGVYLIVVPYNVPLDKIPEFIMSHLPETIQKRLQEERTLADIQY